MSRLHTSESSLRPPTSFSLIPTNTSLSLYSWVGLPQSQTFKLPASSPIPGITRADQDAFAIGSYEKSKAAVDGGVFDSELCPVVIPGKRGKADVVVNVDEEFNKVNFRLDVDQQLIVILTISSARYRFSTHLPYFLLPFIPFLTSPSCLPSYTWIFNSFSLLVQ